MAVRTLALITAAALSLPATAHAQASARGADKFAELCAACHGAGAAGGQGPSLIDAVWKHGSDDDSLARSIRQGYPPKMPPFGQVLPEADIRAVVAFLNEKRNLVDAQTRATQPNSGPNRIPGGIVRTVAASFRVETIDRKSVV